MIKDLHGAVETVARFIGHTITSSTVSLICEQASFQAMQSNPTTNYSWAETNEGCQPFIRKGIVGDWKNHFSKEQSDRLDREYSRHIIPTGLEFDFL